MSFWAVRHKPPYLTDNYATFYVYFDFTEPLLSNVRELVRDCDLRAGRRRSLHYGETMSAIQKGPFYASLVLPDHSSPMRNVDSRPPWMVGRFSQR